MSKYSKNYRSEPYNKKKFNEDQNVIFIYFDYIKYINDNNPEIVNLDKFINLYLKINNKIDQEYYKNNLDINLKSLFHNLSDTNDKISIFTAFYIENYIKPYISREIGTNPDFINEEHKKRQINLLIEMLKFVLYTTKYINARYLYNLVSLMEQNGFTGIITINNDKLNKLFNEKIIEKSITIDMKKDIFKDHLNQKYDNFTIKAISNTFICDLIEMLYPEKEKFSGGSKRRTKKIYIGSRGGKYTISIKNGKKIKKYIK